MTTSIIIAVFSRSSVFVTMVLIYTALLIARTESFHKVEIGAHFPHPTDVGIVTKLYDNIIVNLTLYVVPNEEAII